MFNNNIILLYMTPLMMIFINLMFILIFLVILIDVKQKKNIDLAVNSIGVFILIMFLKIILYINAIYQGKSSCDIMKDWFNC